jgi:hypothetical protein
MSSSFSPCGLRPKTRQPTNVHLGIQSQLQELIGSRPLGAAAKWQLPNCLLHDGGPLAGTWQACFTANLPQAGLQRTLLVGSRK